MSIFKCNLCCLKLSVHTSAQANRALPAGPVPQPAQALIVRVQAANKLKERSARPAPQKKKEDSDSFDETAVLLYSEKVARVTLRRNTLLEDRNESLRKLTMQWEEKISTHTALQSQEESAHTRQKRWLTLLTAVNRLQVLGNIVAMARATKAKDIRA